MRRNVTYLQISILTASLGVILYCAKMHRFAWGDIEVLTNHATINDLWYYNLEGISQALFCGSFAYLTTHFLKIYQQSIVCWVLKYSSIAFGMAIATRAIFHIITYNKVSILEMAVDLCLITYTAYRARRWYKTYLQQHELTPHRNIM